MDPGGEQKPNDILPGVDNDVRSIAVEGAALYVGGDFEVAGADTAHKVAMWDGSGWRALGNGVKMIVQALAVGSGGVYVGGVPWSAGEGVELNSIGFWNGTKWNQLGGGITDTTNVDGVGVVLDIEVIGGDVYATGNFTKAGSVPAKNAAKWNGSEWEALGNGIVGTGQVSDHDGTNYYVGHERWVSMWDGSVWQEVAAVDNGPGVYALRVQEDTLYVGGQFESAVGVTVKNIGMWDGRSWANFGPGVDARVTDIVLMRSELVVCGWFENAGDSPVNYIARWTGTAWEPVGGGAGSRVFALANDFGHLCAGGAFVSIGGVKAHRIAKWDGIVWSALK